MSENIKHLLHQVAEINKRYEEIAEITGENFNIFKIMGVETNRQQRKH